MINKELADYYSKIQDLKIAIEKRRVDIREKGIPEKVKYILKMKLVGTKKDPCTKILGNLQLDRSPTSTLIKITYLNQVVFESAQNVTRYKKGKWEELLQQFYDETNRQEKEIELERKKEELDKLTKEAAELTMDLTFLASDLGIENEV